MLLNVLHIVYKKLLLIYIYMKRIEFLKMFQKHTKKNLIAT